MKIFVSVMALLISFTTLNAYSGEKKCIDVNDKHFCGEASKPSESTKAETPPVDSIEQVQETAVPTATVTKSFWQDVGLVNPPPGKDWSCGRFDTKTKTMQDCRLVDDAATQEQHAERAQERVEREHELQAERAQLERERQIRAYQSYSVVPTMGSFYYAPRWFVPSGSCYRGVCASAQIFIH